MDSPPFCEGLYHARIPPPFGGKDWLSPVSLLSPLLLGASSSARLQQVMAHGVDGQANFLSDLLQRLPIGAESHDPRPLFQDRIRLLVLPPLLDERRSHPGEHRGEALTPLVTGFMN